MVRNLLKTKDKLCTTTEVTVENSVARILEENGYRADPPETWLLYSSKDGMALVLPYVGDGPARKLSRAAKESGLPMKLEGTARYDLDDDEGKYAAALRVNKYYESRIFYVFLATHNERHRDKDSFAFASIFLNGFYGILCPLFERYYYYSLYDDVCVA
ncbi:hypothetical protein ANCDUO_03217 [Ancylostoma duodenale]|uniref:Uncharacterized protein n=1 Tax=Ancylostoma duodenale TaxID=51022 RepID=A0A0C2GY79_9BILA|nr:hypothetical protein ANCDUO_03217 [Ancylostoma duodenale]